MGEDGGGQRKYSDDEAYEKRSGWWQTVVGCIMFSETVVTKDSLGDPYIHKTVLDGENEDRYLLLQCSVGPNAALTLWRISLRM